ncbi:MAG: hypothetical protein E6J04_00780, partial [Chloroflexi bacterium]
MTPAPSRLSSTSSSQVWATSSGAGCFGRDVPPALPAKAERGEREGRLGGVKDTDGLGAPFKARLPRLVEGS